MPTPNPPSKVKAEPKKIENESQEEEAQKVQMRFSARTMGHVKHLKELTGLDNRTQLVSSSVQLTDALKSKLQEGGRLLIEHEDGTRDYITIVGI